MDKKAVLKVDGKEIPMNYFVSEVFINVIDALVNSLDKVEVDKKKIEIIIEEKK